MSNMNYKKLSILLSSIISMVFLPYGIGYFINMIMRIYNINYPTDIMSTWGIGLVALAIIIIMLFIIGYTIIYPIISLWAWLHDE